MSDFEQLSLFGETPNALPAHQSGDSSTVGLDRTSTLEAAVDIYLVALELSGASHHTVKAFRSDLNLLASWAGSDKELGTFSTATLNKFLHWMLTERDKPCSPKTYARRVTTLKNFFSYLTEEGAVPKDPAAAIIQQPVSSPLPEVLLDEERERALTITQALSADPDSPDTRPHFLLTLILETGIKKSECMALQITDFVRDYSDAPFLWIRYSNPRHRYKERKIQVSSEMLDLLAEYLSQHKSASSVVFDCTARNLEYVLRDVALQADVARNKLSFETLRWTCALTDYLDGMEEDKLREKLGLSRVRWRDTSSRLQEMTEEYRGLFAQQAELPHKLDRQSQS